MVLGVEDRRFNLLVSMPIRLGCKKQLLLRWLKDLARSCCTNTGLLIAVTIIFVYAHLIGMTATVLLLVDHTSAHTSVVRILILHRDNYVRNALTSTC
jgi:hypothetical protein